MEQEPFYRDGKLYDVMHESLITDIEFFVQRALAAKGSVLEIACGTGRITIPIAQKGVEITGLDISKQMLLEAKNKSQKSGLDIEWIEADCRNFSIKKKFDLIFIAFNSMLHLHDRLSLEAFFSSVKNHLKPSGKFLIDIFNPSVNLLSRKRDERTEVMKFADPYSGKPAVIHETINYDSANQVNQCKWFYSIGDKTDVAVHDLNLRCIYPQELEALLYYNGFTIVEKLGKYDGTLFSSQSMKQIVTCELEG